MRKLFAKIFAGFVYVFGWIVLLLDMVGRGEVFMNLDSTALHLAKFISEHQELGYRIAPWFLMIGSTLFLAYLQWWPKSDKAGVSSIAEPVYLPNVDTELPLAILLMAYHSAWGRWFSAQELALKGRKIEELFLMRTAAMLVSAAAVDGHLQILGKPFGKIDYEVIPMERWRFVYFAAHPSPTRVWDFPVTPCHGVDPGSVSAVLNYESLMVKAIEFEKLWPKSDRQTDKARKKFLKQARQKGVDHTLVDQLS